MWRGAVFGLIVLAAACGQQDTPQNAPINISGSNGESEQFDAAREEAASLVTGVVFHWTRASEDVRNLYALTSVDAIGVPETDRGMYARVFRRCMDEEAARAASGKSLGDISYECAEGIRYAMTR